jgi:hypothetical protein
VLLADQARLPRRLQQREIRESGWQPRPGATPHSATLAIAWTSNNLPLGNNHGLVHASCMSQQQKQLIAKNLSSREAIGHFGLDLCAGRLWATRMSEEQMQYLLLWVVSFAQALAYRT